MAQRDTHVLVTGGAGYIGSHAVLALLDAGYRVSVIDDLSTGSRTAVPAAAAFHRGDIGDAAALAQIFAATPVDAIMHFAGSIVVPDSVTDPLRYYHNNTVKSRALIAAAVAAGVPHFLFSSTAAVYGEPARVPIDEDSAAAPINPYGASKLMTERMLADTAAVLPMNYGVLRYFNVAGADPAGRAGQVSERATHLIKVAAEAVVGKRAHVAMFGDDFPTPDGTGVRDYIHVSDLAAAHVLTLAALMAEPGRSLVMNCGYGRGYSVREVLDAVDRVAGTPIARRQEPRRAGDPPALVADNTRILATLPWQPRFADLDTIVAHALAWERRLAG